MNRITELTESPARALANWREIREEALALRPQSAPANTFRFGEQTITTRVNVMTPRRTMPSHVDVTAAMDDHAHGRGLRLPVIDNADPFAEVDV